MPDSKKICFLDRDGVINKKADEHCYITRVEDFIFNDRIFDLCNTFKEEGFEFIVITNQRGISRSLYTEKTLDEIHQYMKKGFLDKGIDILDILYCPHGHDDCDCRKPKPGMLKKAYEKYDISLQDSVLISDSQDDIVMGKIFGLGKNIFVISDTLEVIL